MSLFEKNPGRKTMARPPKTCPAEAFQKMISGKYKLRILWALKEGPKRYNEIQKGLLTGSIGTREISPRVLSRELKALGESRMILRHDFRAYPLRVEYSLSNSGKKFIPLIAAMHRWSEKYWFAKTEGTIANKGIRK